MQYQQSGLQLLHFLGNGAKLHSMPVVIIIIIIEKLCIGVKKFSNESTWRMLQVNNYL